MSDAIAALELRIEQAWLDLATNGPGAKRTIWLTPRLCLFGIARVRSDPPPGAIEVGTYMRSITLAELRADVFEALQELSRG